MPSSLRNRGPLALAALTAALVLAACGGDGDGGGDGQGPVHVHGLGINPANEGLLIAAHTGLFSSQPGEDSSERVGENFEDLMGFTVVRPDHFFGSGHPAPGQGGPSSVGLIESRDGGQSWQQVSLAGQADFHVLRFAHNRVYGYNSLTGRMMISDDGGREWVERRPPAGVIDLAVDPDNPRRIIASTERGLAITEDEGRRWSRLRGDIGLVAWPEPDRLYLVNARGRVQLSDDAAGRWLPVGSIDGQPAALAAAASRELYAALGDRTVLSSGDGGASWEVRARP